MRPKPRIAILAHSTNPRGGVVHSLELGDALTRLGHAVTVFAPDPTGKGFFRDTLCRTVCVPASPAGQNVREMVEIRATDYLRYFSQAENRRFDVWHAQDGISGNALATLKERGQIPAFVRTVHHVDSFDDEKLSALQLRAIRTADRRLVVSRLWRDFLTRELALDAELVGNGVDTQRFSSVTGASDQVLRARLGLRSDAPVFLAVGGVEERKNTIRLLQAFLALLPKYPGCRLVIAGGASLLDHHAYQARFAEVMEQSDAATDAVITTGPLPQELMPAVYRAAGTLVFPSTREGFGLVVLEAMASGVPVVTSQIAPFTEYLDSDDVEWCDPFDVGSIASAMARSVDAAHRSRLIARGRSVAVRHSWDGTARAHLAVYDALREPVHA
jgi:glycosyltransferase-like protein